MIPYLRRKFLGVTRLGKQALKQRAFGFSLRKLGATLRALQRGGLRAVAARDADLGELRRLLVGHTGRFGKRLQQLQSERRSGDFLQQGLRFMREPRAALCRAEVCPALQLFQKELRERPRIAEPFLEGFLAFLPPEAVRIVLGSKDKKSP